MLARAYVVPCGLDMYLHDEFRFNAATHYMQDQPRPHTQVE